MDNPIVAILLVLALVVCGVIFVGVISNIMTSISQVTATPQFCKMHRWQYHPINPVNPDDGVYMKCKVCHFRAGT